MGKFQVVESGVTFGGYEEENVFHIEKILTDLQYGEGVNKVEFILKQGVKNSALWFVEVKSSIPKEAFDFFNEIKLKIIHSLTIYFCVVCGRHSALQSYLTDRMKRRTNLKLPIKLVLVIPKVPDSYLNLISDKFKKVLEVERKIWDIKYEDIIILNENRARKYQLIGVSK